MGYYYNAEDELQEIRARLNSERMKEFELSNRRAREDFFKRGGSSKAREDCEREDALRQRRGEEEYL
jgi:hypothetical protein